MTKTMTKTTIISTLVAIGLVASTAAAFAAPANATTALNVRSGPGGSYGVVDTLLPGEAVEVTECVSNGWCHIQHPGPDGWVSSNYLTAGGAPAPIEPASEDPDVNFGFGVDSNGNFSFGIGIGGAPVLPIPTPPAAEPAEPVETAKVCFYNGLHFNGTKFCVSPGSADNKLGSNWNNKISSIKMFGGASVKVCRDANYGSCKTYGTNKGLLGPLMNNKITSFKAY